MNSKLIVRLIFCLGIALLMTAAEAFAQKEAASFQIVPGVKVGAITARSSEADLKRIYGSRNVRSDEIGLGEGETVPGTILYPDDPRRRLSIVWKNAKLKKNPDFVQFHDEKSLWKIAPGIGIGTTLKTLEQINGRGFVLLGFQWDYSGTVVSWNGGKLARRLGNDSKLVTLMLNPRTYDNPALTKDLDAVVGDGEFSSKNKSMQKINPAVYFAIVKFP